MTDELTLREKVLGIFWDFDSGLSTEDAMKRLSDALEDTGAPAHMRVAAELRGLDEDMTWKKKLQDRVDSGLDSERK